MSERETETEGTFDIYFDLKRGGNCAPKIQLELQVCFLANCMHTHAYSTGRLGTQLLCLSPSQKNIVQYTRRVNGFV